MALGGRGHVVGDLRKKCRVKSALDSYESSARVKTRLDPFIQLKIERQPDLLRNIASAKQEVKPGGRYE